MNSNTDNPEQKETLPNNMQIYTTMAFPGTVAIASALAFVQYAPHAIIDEPRTLAFSLAAFSIATIANTFLLKPERITNEQYHHFKERKKERQIVTITIGLLSMILMGVHQYLYKNLSIENVDQILFLGLCGLHMSALTNGSQSFMAERNKEYTYQQEHMEL